MEAKKVVGEASDPSPFVVALHTKSRTPDHPPYAEMVRVALLALAEAEEEEEEGSTEAAISAYIVAAFSGLPPGHANLLPYYLRKLVASGFLAAPSPGRYLLLLPPSPPSPSPQNPNPNPNPNPSPSPSLEPSSSPRHHGRLLKNATEAPAETETAVEPVEAAPVRRGRGRPRKRAAVAAADAEVSAAIKEEKKKKRGEEKHGADIVAPPV